VMVTGIILLSLKWALNLSQCGFFSEKTISHTWPPLYSAHAFTLTFFVFFLEEVMVLLFFED
jgi:hypothetical protein